MSKICIQGNNLTKDFGKGKGVFDLDIDVKEGQVLGFLGPNGAGKTTTILMLLGLVYPDNGSIKLFDRELTPQNRHTFMDDIGIMFGDPAYPKGLRVIDIFKQRASLTNQSSFEKLLEIANDIDLDIHKKFSKLSLGNKKKVSLCIAFSNKPKILILD